MKSTTMANLPLFSLSLLFLFSISGAQVPKSQTFRYVNEGEFGPYITEYGASYRFLPIGIYPFQLCFYNATLGAFFLALRMGTPRSESIFRWVWDANRGRPVGENATLTFSSDGNLVLAEADGRVAWQTGTANKKVVGLRLLPNGNLVLHDRAGKFVWQSFDHPTDTLLVGQSLRPSAGQTKLMARASPADNSEGRYSLVMESGGLAMYMVVSGNSRLAYYNYSYGYLSSATPPPSITFTSEPETDDAFVYELELVLTQGGTSGGSLTLGRPKYNGTLSILRIGLDGNLRTYTFYDKVDYRAWEETFTLFSEDGFLDGCRLPAKCGALGVCENEMCVACPAPQGLLGWSSTCALPKPKPCGGGADYFKVDGVEHFLNAYDVGVGPMKVAECKDKCTKDCKCVGFFYRQESSKCLLVPLLGTLSKVSNASHVGYIKIFK